MTDFHDTGIAPQCFTCAHLRPLAPDLGWTCLAFPRGIPKQIMVNLVDHREAYPGDRGVRWEIRTDLAPHGRIDDGRVENLIRAIAASGPRLDENKPPARAAGVLFLTPDHKILLVRRSADHERAGEWGIPAGHIEGEETAAEAAAREAEEETGRKVAVGDLAEWTRRVADGVDFTTFLAAVPETFEPVLSAEHDAHDWVTLGDVMPRKDAGWREEDHPRGHGGKFSTVSDVKEEPFEKVPKIGWWRDKEHLDLYHGTHERNLMGVANEGVHVKDPKTGMVSMTLDPHTAHGYAAMSGVGGERDFRKAHGKAKNTPPEERVVTHFRVPRSWVEENVDKRLGGNLGETEKRMKDPAEYDRWRSKHGGDKDAEYYGTSELRFSNPIPPHYFAGYQRKVKGPG